VSTEINFKTHSCATRRQRHNPDTGGGSSPRCTLEPYSLCQVEMTLRPVLHI